MTPPSVEGGVLDGLNEQQREAVAHLGGPLLIVAGAGSGKTRTLTRRFEWLVAQGFAAERILALTYTNAAAAELAERIEQAIGATAEEINARTFHSLCIDILRSESAAAGVNPFFSTATEADRVAIMLARMNELTFDRLELRLGAAHVVNELIKFIDRLKEDCVGPEQLLSHAEDALNDAADPDARAEAERLIEQAGFYFKHEQFLREAGVLDFGGMQLQTYRLLAGNEEVRRRVARRFEHILVDEFQDTSYVQLEILRMLAADHRNIAAVGDDDQSIYRFRGASARSIKHFGARFGEHRRIELDLNYRSAPPIIDAARAVVAQIDESRRVPKELRAAIDKLGGVQFWECASEVAESQAIVGEIERLIADEGVEPREIAVLVRQRAHADVLIDRLKVHGIPHVVDTRDFFQRSEIRIPLSWLKVLANPTLNEDAWRMLSAPPVGLDSAEYAALMRWMSKNKHPHVVVAMRAALRQRNFGPEMLDKLKSFVDTFDAAAGLLDELRPGEFTIRLINRISLKGTILARGDDDAPARLANLGKLQSMAEDFAARRPQATARDFALYITAMAEAGIPEASEQAEQNPNAVRVMTAHQSKGLEFDYVFIPGAISTRWPGGRMHEKFEMPESLMRDAMPLPDAEAKEQDRKRAAHVEEVRRLMHVAMTRARTQLIVSRFDPGARAVNGHKPSLFFEEALIALRGEPRRFEERDFETPEFVFAEIAELRGELMRIADRTGAQLGEMRLDAGSDTPASFARFAELVKLTALSHRLRLGQTIAGALPEVNDMLKASMSSAQRSEFENSALDQRLLAAEQRAGDLARVIGSLTPQLANYLPVTNDRLRLSASDIAAYQRCPKAYEYEKVLKIPVREQSHLRLGTLVHTVLERYHRDHEDGGMPVDAETARERLLKLLDQAAGAAGWGSSDGDRQLFARARRALENYADSEYARPEGQVQLERKFSLLLEPTPSMADTLVGGRHLTGIQVNGRIDRIDSLPDGTRRLIDYKTGKRKTRGEIAKEVQLALYRLAASEALGFEASELVYYFMEEDDPAVTAAATDERVAEVRETINAVADAIVRLDFEPAPEHQKCQFCAFNRVCPATER